MHGYPLNHKLIWGLGRKFLGGLVNLYSCREIRVRDSSRINYACQN